MTDRCEKCGRERVGERKHVNSTRCLRTGDGGCVAVAGAYRRGLREGVELAMGYARADGGVDSEGRVVRWVNWYEVDAELERRLK